MSKTILIVANSPSPNCQRLRQAVFEGAVEQAGNNRVLQLEPQEAEAQHILDASGLILGTTENFGYMSGIIKDFFERIYYDCLEHTEALPVALYVRAGNDGQGAVASMEPIVTGLRWKQISQPLICSGPFSDLFISQCQQLGATMAAGIDMGIL